MTYNTNALVAYDASYRTRWMVPRNKRSIQPWKMVQVLAIVHLHSTSNEWSGNQQLQNSFCKALEEAGLKKPGIQFDPKSGGPRTYLSQLECLGLTFKRGSSILFTRAGQDILDGAAPVPILQKMLLRHQYPSAYGSGRNVRINPSVRVKPFLFILELLNQPGIKFLTEEELAVALVLGHNRKCLQLCVDKIMQLREGVPFRDIVDDYRYLLTRRTKDTDKALNAVRADANVFKNYLDACRLVCVDKKNGRQIIQFNEEFRPLYEEHLDKADKFIPLDSVESFQRRYGAWDGRKDTRALAGAETGIDAAKQMILSRFYSYCEGRLVSSTHVPDDFIRELANDYGFKRDVVMKAIEPHMPRSEDIFDNSFLETARSGKKELGTKFELMVAELFRARFSTVAEHTGQKKRPAGKIGGYADIFLIFLDENQCAIVDAKASASYTLPHKDYAAMVQTYIPNYGELANNRPLEIQFAAYVAGGFSSGITGRLKAVEENTNVPCSAITARQLLSLSLTEQSADRRQDMVRTRLTESCVIE